MSDHIFHQARRKHELGLTLEQNRYIIDTGAMPQIHRMSVEHSYEVCIDPFYSRLL
jgi:hypothetical protein